MKDDFCKVELDLEKTHGNPTGGDLNGKKRDEEETWDNMCQLFENYNRFPTGVQWIITERDLEELRKVIQRGEEHKAATTASENARLLRRVDATYLTNMVMKTPVTVECLKMYTARELFIMKLEVAKLRTRHYGELCTPPFPKAEDADHDEPGQQGREDDRRLPWEDHASLQKIGTSPNTNRRNIPK
jgi:hypothetical protein